MPEITAQEVFAAVDLAEQVAKAIMEAVKAGEPKAVQIARAQSVLDRAKAVDNDVDGVLAGKA